MVVFVVTAVFFIATFLVALIAVAIASRIMDSQAAQPSAETLNRLAAALEIEVEVLYDAAWTATDETLPSLPTYFRSKYQLSDDQIAAVQQAFDQATKPAPVEPPKRGRPPGSTPSPAPAPPPLPSA